MLVHRGWSCLQVFLVFPNVASLTSSQKKYILKPSFLHALWSWNNLNFISRKIQMRSSLMKILQLLLSETFKILFRTSSVLKFSSFFPLLNENRNTRQVFNSSEEYLIFLSCYFTRLFSHLANPCCHYQAWGSHPPDTWCIPLHHTEIQKGFG